MRTAATAVMLLSDLCLSIMSSLHHYLHINNNK